MAKEPKITVTHYLNVNLKPYVIDGVKKYKLYFLVRANNQNTKLKSFCDDDDYSEAEYEELRRDEKSDLSIMIKLETEFLNIVVGRIIKDGKNFKPDFFSRYLKHYKRPIRDIIDKIEETTPDTPYSELFYFDTFKKEENKLKYKLEFEVYSKAKEERDKIFETTSFLTYLIFESIESIDYLFSENIAIDDLFAGQWLMKSFRVQLEKRASSLNGYSKEKMNDLNDFIKNHLDSGVYIYED